MNPAQLQQKLAFEVLSGKSPYVAKAKLLYEVMNRVRPKKKVRLWRHMQIGPGPHGVSVWVSGRAVSTLGAAGHLAKQVDDLQEFVQLYARLETLGR